MTKKHVGILKKILSVSLAMILGLSCFACDAPCSHRDANDDGDYACGAHLVYRV